MSDKEEAGESDSDGVDFNVSVEVERLDERKNKRPLASYQSESGSEESNSVSPEKTLSPRKRKQGRPKKDKSHKQETLTSPAPGRQKKRGRPSKNKGHDNDESEKDTETLPNPGRQKKKRGRPSKNKDYDESDKDLESSPPKRERRTLQKPETDNGAGDGEDESDSAKDENYTGSEYEIDDSGEEDDESYNPTKGLYEKRGAPRKGSRGRGRGRPRQDSSGQSRFNSFVKKQDSYLLSVEKQRLAVEKERLQVERERLEVAQKTLKVAERRLELEEDREHRQLAETT